MTPDGALAFVRDHGIVLASGRGPVPNLAEAVVGTPIRGSWWSHPDGREIFRLMNAVAVAPDVLVCRLVQGKRTFVHRRVWSALARLEGLIPARSLARVIETHTATGRHAVTHVAFGEWLPADVAAGAAKMSEQEALAALGDWARDGFAAVPRR